MSTTLANVQIRLGAEITQFQRGLRAAERELERTAARFNSVGNNLSLALTLPLAAAGAAAVKFATGFETATTKIENLVGVQGQELEDLKQKFKELGPVVGKTQTELADAALFITGAGLRGADALEALEISAKASAIGLGEQTAIAKVAGAAVAAYGAENISATQSVDKLLAAIQQGNAEAADLAPVLGRSLGVAAQLGVNLDEVLAGISTYTRLGISAEGATDGLKSALGSLLKPSDDAKKSLAKIGLTFDDVRKSLKDNGLAATLQSLVKGFGSDNEGLARVFSDVQGLQFVLGTAGSQAEEYNNILKEIQNSSGGVSAAFEKTAQTAEFKLQKAFASLNAAGTEIGAALVPAVVALAEAVVPLAQGFASLDSGTQKFIVGMLAAAAAAGPLFKLIGGSIEIYSAARSAVLSFSKGLQLAQGYFQSLAPAVGSVRAGLGAVAVAWRTMDVVAKSTVIGLALGVVVALGAAFYSLSQRTSEAARIQRSLNDITLTAEKNIAAERLEAERLIGVVNSNTASKEAQADAIKRLNQISPEYFGNLSTEESRHNANTGALKKYTNALLESAKAQAAQERLVELEKRKLDLLQAQEKAKQKSNNTLLLETAFNALAVPGTGTGSGFQQQAAIKRELAAIKREQDAIVNVTEDANAANAALRQQAVRTAGVPITGNVLPTGAPLPTGKAPKAAKPETFDGFKNTATGLIVIEDSAILVNDQLEKLATKTIPELSTANTSLAVFQGRTVVKMYETNEATAALSEQLLRQKSIMDELGSAASGIIESGLTETLVGVGSAIADIFSGTASSGSVLAAVLEPILGMMEQLGKVAIGAGIAIAGIKKAFETLNPVAAIAAGVGLIALSKLVRGQLKSLQPQAFASGDSIITGPTYALLGEYPGASTNPEYVFRGDQLKKAVREAGGGGGAVQVYGRLYGGDILLSNERSNDRRMRARGY